MTSNQKVAQLRSLDNVTAQLPQKGATPGATHYSQIDPKPSSVSELRAQLLAQRQRNKAATLHPAEESKVAQEVAAVASCAVAFPIERNSATDLVREFMEVDGLSCEEAQALAAVSVTPRSPATWLALIAELNRLIDRYCQACRLSEEARGRILKIRKGQSLSLIPATVEWFKRELADL